MTGRCTAATPLPAGQRMTAEALISSGDGGYGDRETHQEEPVSAQPEHLPVLPYAPAPGAPAELLVQLRADRRADRWVPAFEQEWAAALEESRRTFSLTTLYEVVQVWQARVASAPVVDAFLASGKDDTEFVDLEEIRSRRR